MKLELCGDAPLSRLDKVRFVTRNLWRNLAVPTSKMLVERFCHERLSATSSQASPGRALTEAFIMRRLPSLLNRSDVRILEIGCGSGRLASQLASSGLRGSYTGMDVHDRFDHTPVAGLEKRFILGDAQTYEPEGTFDLVISVSAMEHIEDDRLVVKRVRNFLAPGAIQLHVVPSGWGLLVYLWHGWRQYTLASTAERFDVDRTTVYTFGGLFSFFLHFVFITLGELIFRFPVRRRMTTVYATLLNGALRLDRYVPLCPTMLAICERAPASLSSCDE